MPTQIQVPGEGIVEFPDSMDDDAIKSVLQKKFPARNTQPPEDFPQSQAPASAALEIAGMASQLGTPDNPPKDLNPRPTWKQAAQELPGGFKRFIGDIADTKNKSILGLDNVEIPSGANTTMPGLTIPISSAAKATLGAAQYLSSPQGLAEAAISTSAAGPLVYGKWAFDMLKGGIQSVKEVKDSLAQLIRESINRGMTSSNDLGISPKATDAEINQHLQELSDGIVNGVVMTAGGLGAAGHAISGAAKFVPKGKAAEVPTTNAPNIIGDIPIPDRINAIDQQLAQYEQKLGPRDSFDSEKGKAIPARILDHNESDLLKLRDELSAKLPPPASVEAVAPTQTDPATDSVPLTGAPQSAAEIVKSLMPIRNHLFLEELPKHTQGTAGRARVQSRIDEIDKLVKQAMENQVIPINSDATQTPQVPPVETPAVAPEAPTETPLRGENPVPSVEATGVQQTGGEPGSSASPAAGEVTVKSEAPGAPPEAAVPAPAPDTGIAASARRKWATATDEGVGNQGVGSESAFFTLQPLKDLWDKYTPNVKAAAEAARSIYKEQSKLGKTSDYRRSILNWSAKLQRSFGEAADAQKEIRSVIKDPVRLDAATNWLEAGGDPAILRDRLAKTLAWRDPTTGKPHPQQKELAAGYEAALHLTPEELKAVGDARGAYDALGTRGQTWDVLNSFKKNYVTHIWDLNKGPTGGGSARTLKDRFRFSKASTFPTFFDGEQAGFIPKTKDLSKLLPVYLHEMNSVIAARQLVAEMSKGKASDGRPLLAPRGAGTPIETTKFAVVNSPGGKAVKIYKTRVEAQAALRPGQSIDPRVENVALVMPDAIKGDSKDYKAMEGQPALHDWAYASKDSAGNPVLVKSDLVVHPEAAAKFKNVLGRSAISEWYDSKTSASAAIPKGIVKGLDWFQSQTKRTMLGLLTPFHQVQEGTHAVGHRVNPFFNNPTIDLVNNPAQMDAAKHGLMLLPDRASESMFMDGFKQSGIVSHIPALGPLADHYSNYLFHQYIPGIKFKTYEAILKRNQGVYAKDLAAGKVSLEDVKILSAEQANAAYGHLNYADLARNPTILHIMRLGLLAPDFLEARFRFAGQAIKGATGAKVGREQIIALASLALAQATLAWTSAKLTGGQWDAKDPFTFHIGNRKFTMRSVPEDAVRAATDTRAFGYARINPVIGKAALEYSTGTDWRGQKIKAGQVTKQILQQPIPLALRPLFGTDNSPMTGWEQLASAAGLKITRYSAQTEVRKLAHAWMDASPDTSIKAAEDRYQKENPPDSDYKPLREALINNDFKTARKEYDKLLETRKPDLISKTFASPHPFSGSSARETKFKASLSDDQKALYAQAKKEQKDLLQKFYKMRNSPTAKK